MVADSWKKKTIHIFYCLPSPLSIYRVVILWWKLERKEEREGEKTTAGRTTKINKIQTTIISYASHHRLFSRSLDQIHFIPSSPFNVYTSLHDSLAGLLSHNPIVRPHVRSKGAFIVAKQWTARGDSF